MKIIFQTLAMTTQVHGTVPILFELTSQQFVKTVEAAHFKTGILTTRANANLAIPATTVKRRLVLQKRRKKFIKYTSFP